MIPARKAAAPLADVEALAVALRARAAALPNRDLGRRAACFVIPQHPWRPGFDHALVWPGALADFDAHMARGDALRLAMAYLLLEIERLETTDQAATA